MSNAANTSNVVNLNGQNRKLLPLNWKQLKERREDIIVINNLKPGGMFTEQEQDAIARVICASLQRSDEAITLEYVEKNLDLGNVGDMLKMVFGQKVNTGAASGEAGAATSQS